MEDSAKLCGRVHRNPTWGTCAGLILLAESANRTKKDGQDLIGGLDVRVNRNHFGRQTESFEASLTLPFLERLNEDDDDDDEDDDTHVPSELFHGVFIRAPVVEKLLPPAAGEQIDEGTKEDTVIAPSRTPATLVDATKANKPVEIMAVLPGRKARLAGLLDIANSDENAGDIIAVRQGNVFGTSFHPELTQDPRIHIWWLQEVCHAMSAKRKRKSTMDQIRRNEARAAR